MALSGRILPIHHGPSDGEALSSWLTRLAIGHHLIPSIFFRISIRSQQDIFKQDIDIKCPQSVIEEISVFTGKLLSVVEQTTFMPFQDYLYIHNQASTALPRWVGPTYIRKSTEHHFGLKICPECMRESPYIRLLWRCTFFLVCPRHSIKLIDRCERCGSPKSTRRIFAGIMDDHPGEALCYCHSCGWDYRQATLNIATPSEKDHVALMLEVLKKGFYKSLTFEVGYSHLFFAGIRLLMNGLYRLGVSSQYDIEKHSELEFLPVDVVSGLMESAFLLLDNWPCDFVNFCRKRGLGRSSWIHPREAAPYWLDAVLKWEVNLAKYSVSDAEIENVYHYLAKTEDIPDRKKLVALLGGTATPRKLIKFRRAELKKYAEINELKYHKFYAQSETANKNTFVTLRTIVYLHFLQLAKLKHREVCNLKYNTAVADVSALAQWLGTLDANVSNRVVLDMWFWYEAYINERKKLVATYGTNEFLFLTYTGHSISISLAIKSIKRESTDIL